jgi:hypothetical protein
VCVDPDDSQAGEWPVIIASSATAVEQDADVVGGAAVLAAETSV